jgi:hypothetical protein
MTNQSTWKPRMSNEEAAKFYDMDNPFTLSDRPGAPKLYRMKEPPNEVSPMSDIDTITERADKFARIIMDQLAADRCGNLENIRNVLVAPLMQAMREDVDAGAANLLAVPIEPPRSGPQPIPMPEVSAYMTRLRELTDGAEKEIRKLYSGEFLPDDRVMEVFDKSLYRHKEFAVTMQFGVSAEEARQKAKITDPVLDWRNYARHTEDMRKQVRATGLAMAKVRGHPIQTSVDLDEYAMPDGRIINGLQLIEEGHKS